MTGPMFEFQPAALTGGGSIPTSRSTTTAATDPAVDSATIQRLRELFVADPEAYEEELQRIAREAVKQRRRVKQQGVLQRVSSRSPSFIAPANHA